MKQDLQISNGEELYKNLLLVDPSAGQLDYKCRSDSTEGWNVLCKIIEVVTFHSFFFLDHFFYGTFFKIEAVQHRNMRRLYKICRSFKIHPQR